MVYEKTRCFFNIFVENVNKPNVFSTFFVNAEGSDPCRHSRALYHAREPHSVNTVWGKIGWFIRIEIIRLRKIGENEKPRIEKKQETNCKEEQKTNAESGEH